VAAVVVARVVLLLPKASSARGISDLETSPVMVAMPDLLL
jgi:hypothetical protein